jgi:hypothetical protein
MSSNSDDRAFERRLAAVERAVAESTREQPDASPESNATERGDTAAAATTTDAPPPDWASVEPRLETLENRVDELDAALQAVRGFLGGIDAVNEAVESRADAAIAAVDRLERRLDEQRAESDHRELRDRCGRPDTGAESAVDEFSSTGSGGSGNEGADATRSDYAAPENETEPDATDAAADSDRTLRERLSQRW